MLKTLTRSRPMPSGALGYYILAVLIWSSESVVVKGFLLDSLSPEALLSWRFLFTTLFLAPVVLMERPRLGRLTRGDWLQLLLLGVPGTALAYLLLADALLLIPASTAVLLYRLEPVFVILLAVLLYRRRVAPQVWLLTLIAIACSYLIAIGGFLPPALGSALSRGVGLALVSTFLFASSTFLAKSLLDRISPLTLTWLRFVIALIPVWLLYGRAALVAAAGLSAEDLLGLLYLGCITAGLAFFFYYKGLEVSEPVLASLVQLLAPASGLLLSFIILGERFNAIQLAAAVGLMGTLYLLSSKTRS